MFEEEKETVQCGEEAKKEARSKERKNAPFVKLNCVANAAPTASLVVKFLPEFSATASNQFGLPAPSRCFEVRSAGGGHFASLPSLTPALNLMRCGEVLLLTAARLTV